ncbi:carbohydrate porin [Phenylobacterium sp.]|jgi:high affinity Mn2+ porin|uniref:carbohydrate porin n=1 Tax=Phenylobacterium sp. TaxID=1871053 RepID=UPI002E33E805|nr:carbohydrate porin [Phenylobacterium sp.]HEX3365914.1 carbohydrate porin [Phenylobacterium sp.]
MTRHPRLWPAVTALVIMLIASPALAQSADKAGDDEAPQSWAVHGQATFVDQANAAFRSPYRGANSLDPAARGRETADVTLYAGARLWPGMEVWINPEIDQGFGLSDTLGVAGFPSGEAYKVGMARPYFRLQRLFVRQTIDLGGDSEKTEADLNQLGGSHTADRLVLTVGKFGVPDIFDTNAYAHDPRGDFLNWALIDVGTFDYAADAWGYTVGGAAEWYVGRWTLRGGVFNLSKVPNSEHLEYDFSQFQGIAEIEERHRWGGRPGKLKLTGFLSRGRMGAFDDAVALAQASGQPVDIVAVRRYRSRSGVSLNLEQEVADDLGVFARAGVAGGDVEPYEFADIDRTVSAGLSLKGARWGRKDDTFGLAAVVNDISSAHQRFLAAGGTGILVGDGRLPHAGAEQILEAYYDLKAIGPAHVSFDYQAVNHPAYNRDRGPLSIAAVRLHAQF